METSSKPSHIGRKIARLRELRSIKQDSMAFELGVSQQTVSRIEASETIEDELLEKVAKVLGVTSEAIKHFDVDKAINVISNTFHQHAFINSVGTFNINPIEKWLEALEENKKLYERLLQSEREKIEILKGNQK
ncbi:helix-turn-helix transcriptional regulator [Desertivirga arenae]|uniref:helix-turn-helix transcriptional regulator n=1 Tax=Desertivirga arenae TaxID=2810309 RepID=UPI001A95EAB5|nr:helix-turn-helix transcriptional regulator [Pedobacter sp. SYSU D00823]